MKKQTAVEWLDEQLQERVIAQDHVVRKMIIEISFEDYINLKKVAKSMERQQIIDAYYLAKEYRNQEALYENNGEQYFTETYVE